MSRRGVLALVAALVLAGAAGTSLLLRRFAPRAADVAGAAHAVRYHCPMHPTIVSDRPGDCPICGMRLVPTEQDDRATPQRKVLYRSTMNPGEVSDHPGKDSMGMEMVPVAETTAETPVPGLATVHIPAGKQQLIGVKTSPVVRAPFRRTIRSAGRVAYDETRLAHVHTKVAGFVETLYANSTGEPVRKGQPLLDLYSPELLASQEEYLVALRARARTSGSSIPSIASSGDELVASARRRLELLDLSEAQIRTIEDTGKPLRDVTLYAPSGGTLLERNVTRGQRIEPETDLLTLADLSHVWVLASVHEYELPFVRVGLSAAMTLTYLPGRTFAGRVAFVYPALDAATRTAQVRLEFENPRMELKPDMYAEVTLTADLGERVAVPASAVMDTGTRSVAFVDRGEGTFEPRALTIGLRLSDQYEVLAGLTPGERVLTSANFFVDSESKMRAAFAASGAEP